MFPAWIFLSLNSLFFTLRLSGGVTGSFPRPLKAEEERMYLERMARGIWRPATSSLSTTCAWWRTS